MRKRILSILLTLCMVLCLIPTAVFAEAAPTGTALTQALLGTWLEKEDPYNPNSGKIYKMPAGNYYLAEDICLVGDDADPNSAWPLIISKGAVTLDLNGHVLDLKRQNISIYSNGNLTLTDSSPEAEHKFRVEDSGLWVLDETQGTETVTGGVITGGTGVDSSGATGTLGGGVSVSYGSLTMNGGSIVGCTANNGGGVSVFYGSFTMTGGRIAGCTAVKSGNTYGNGGGVYVGDSATFTMNDGSIVGCTADSGGSVFVDGSATFNMNDGSIENCTADIGGVYVGNLATFNMNDGSIVGCTADIGGGVYMGGLATFNMKGGSIESCTADIGGGVFVDGSATFTMNDGSIENCTADIGGGVCVSSGSFTMEGGSIADCKAGGAPNAVHADGNFTDNSTNKIDKSLVTGIKAGHAGTGADPILIATTAGLEDFRDRVNNGENGLCAKLTADIVLNDGTFDENGNWSESGTPDEWTPIGEGNRRYCGTFDGGGYTIKGLYVDGSIDSAGLFGIIGSDAAISDLIVTGFVAAEQGGRSGGIVGRQYGGSIMGCINACTVQGDYCGGLAGEQLRGSITGCINTSTVQGKGHGGGIVGVQRGGSITNCYNIGTINGVYCGGIASEQHPDDKRDSASITNCYSIGKLADYGCGILDYQSEGNSSVNNCYYLAGTAKYAVGTWWGTQDNVEDKTKTQFAGGDVLALLKKNDTTGAWGECGYLAAAGMTLPLLSWQTADEHTHNKNGDLGGCDCGQLPAGTADDPYLIYTAQDLKLFRDMVNGGNTGICGKLMNDIVLNDGTFDADGTYTGANGSTSAEQWTPIGWYKSDSDQAIYAGTFDGGGHTIKGLYINRDESGIGLFGIVSNATIKNLTVTGYVKGYGSVGGIVGEILEEGNAAIQNCANYCEVTGDTYVGGIVGYIGYNTKGDIRNCANFGTVKGTCTDSYAYVGGIVGYASIGQKMTVVCTACYNVGTVKAKKCAGGLLGYGSMKMDSCYNVGLVEGEEFIGGLVGSALWLIIDGNGMSLVTVDNCYYLDTATKAFGEALFFTGDTSAWRKSKTQFANELLPLLQNGDENSPWTKTGYLAAAGMTLPLLSWQTADAHTHDYQWKYDNTEHRKECSCGFIEQGSKAAHSGNDDGDCTTAVTCVCGATVKTAETAHNWSAWTQNSGNDTHTHKCQRAGCTASETDNCSGGTATCTEQAVCDVCGEKYGKLDSDNHTGTAEWIKTETTHEKKYNCCGTTVVYSEAHVWHDGACLECGYGCVHQYKWKSANGEYWKICKLCDFETDKKAIPTITISGADKVCRTQDYTFTFTFSDDVADAYYSYEFSGIGDGPFIPTVKNGVYSGVLKSDAYVSGEDSFKLVVKAKTADGFTFFEEKTVTIQNEHTGGEATCKDKAICDVCGEKYGKLNPDNHTGTAEWIKTKTTHEKKYNCCGAFAVAKESHEWESGVCLECGYICTHTGGEATCEEKATCTVCGEKYGKLDPDNHTGTAEWIKTETTHEKKYNCCGAFAVAKEAHEWESGACLECGYICTHTGGEATCEEKATCTVCGEKYGKLNPDNHAGTAEWIKTETTHEKKYNCCEAFAVAKEAHEWEDGACLECGYICTHTGGEATCTEKATCDICNEKYGFADPSNHKHTEIRGEKEPTDLEKGYTGDKWCTDCNTIVEKGSEIDKLPHSLEKIKAKKATVTSEGNIEYYRCENCGKYFADAEAEKEITAEETVIKKLPPEITDGNNAFVTKGEKKALSFTSNAAYEDFIGVELDGELLDEKYYTKAVGGIIITLDGELISTLELGGHTVGIISESGTATAEFNVKTAANATDSPETGDDANIVLWCAAAVISLMTVGGVALLPKKKRAR